MDNVPDLLDRIGVFRHPCDVDLLLFFARHPRTLMPSEQLAAFLGYEPAQVAASLDVLIEAKFLERTPNPFHTARLYVFVVTGPFGGWLPALLRLASTRPGRLAIRQVLSPSPAGGRRDSRLMVEPQRSRSGE